MIQHDFLDTKSRSKCLHLDFASRKSTGFFPEFVGKEYPVRPEIPNSDGSNPRPTCPMNSVVKCAYRSLSIKYFLRSGIQGRSVGRIDTMFDPNLKSFQLSLG